MSDHQFIKEYIKDFSRLLVPTDKVIDQLILVRDLLLEAKNNDKKILIFGNSGSAAIASHVSVDMTKNAKLRCLNFNEADLITGFSENNSLFKTGDIKLWVDSIAYNFVENIHQI